jgi:hypothetical protein
MTMTAAGVATWYLEQEARGMLTRLERVRPFAIHETMVPAAALTPTALSAIESFLIKGRRALRGRIHHYLAWLRGPGRTASPSSQQHRYTLLRLEFNSVLSQFDLFTEVVTQRSEHGTGVWLSGLDVLATDALALPTVDLNAPPVACYLARGPGAAIRRAHTRLPGGRSNPVSIIRVPRERMVGYGVASSLVHEVGHQAAALLSLVDVARPLLARARAGYPPQATEVWRHWENWISEIVADMWSVARLGIASTLGLMAVVNLPRWVVFRPSGNDPHPVPWLRVRLSCVMGNMLYPHPQWSQLSALWARLYPPRGLAPAYRALLDELDASMPAFVTRLFSIRPPALRGRRWVRSCRHPNGGRSGCWSSGVVGGTGPRRLPRSRRRWCSRLSARPAPPA